MPGKTRGTKQMRVAVRAQNSFCLKDEQVARIARVGLQLEQVFGTSLVVEWACIPDKKRIAILEVRVLGAPRHNKSHVVELYTLKHTSDVLCVGTPVGSQIASGKVQIIKESGKQTVHERGILVAKQFSQEHATLVRNARGIVVEDPNPRGFGPLFAREAGIPCVYGVAGATENLKNNTAVTLSCANAEAVGKIYKGMLPFEVHRKNISEIAKTRTNIFVRIADTDNAGSLSQFPCDGAGIIEQDNIIKHSVGIHPLALLEPRKITKVADKKYIQNRTRGYRKKQEYAVEKMAQGLAQVAAAFYPERVLLRLSTDVQSYAALPGGNRFKNIKELKWNGASRLIGKAYKKAFELECKAFLKARDEWGLDNITLVVPFCRTPEEAKDVLSALAKNGITSGHNGTKIYFSCDIPANLILAEEYITLCDGFVIGSYANSAETFVEKDNKVIQQMVREVISLAHQNKRDVYFMDDAREQDDDFVDFLVQHEVDGISVEADNIIKARERVAYIESTAGRTGHKTSGKFLSLVIGCAVFAAGLMSLGAGCANLPQNTDAAYKQEEITPAQIRTQVQEQVSAQKEAEYRAEKSKLTLSGFAALELEYPSTWSVKQWNDGISIVSNENPEEYVSIFRQLVSHPAAYTSVVIGNNMQARRALIPLAERKESSMFIYELPLRSGDVTGEVLEINGVGEHVDEIVASLKIDSTATTRVNPTLNHWDVREGRICAEIATFARPSAEGGECSLYNNPCEIPEGWYVCDAKDKL